MKVWHYITKRSDDIQVGDYYTFHIKIDSNGFDRIKPKLNKDDNGKRTLLIKLSLETVILTRLKGKKCLYVWEAKQLSKRRSFGCRRVFGELIDNLSTASNK